MGVSATLIQMDPGAIHGVPWCFIALSWAILFMRQSVIKTLGISLHSWNTPFTPFCSTGSPGVTSPSSLPAHGYWSVCWDRTLPILDIPLKVIKILPGVLAMDRTQQATVALTSDDQYKLYCTSHAENPYPYHQRIYLSPCQWWCRLYSLACWDWLDGYGHNDGHLLSLDTGDWFCRSIAEWLREDFHLQGRLLVHAIPLALVCVRSSWLVGIWWECSIEEMGNGGGILL